MSQEEKLIGVISADTRFIKFCVFKNQENKVIAEYGEPINPYHPREGWMEQDPLEIIEIIKTCIRKVVETLGQSRSKNITTLGITNHRETSIVWDKTNGLPFYNAILWKDNRTDSLVDLILSKNAKGDTNFFQEICGLPISSYFSAFKLKWLIDYSQEIVNAIKLGRCLFGTVDSWIIWNLTGGINGGIHITDVTNASRTFLMNINTLQWDSFLLNTFKINKNILPEIKSSSEIYGITHKGFYLTGVPISGIVGNQQAALIGHNCLKEGEATITYKNGCFVLYSTGFAKIFSTHGLVTTIAYKFGTQPPVYALEGSIAVAGSAVKWVKENLHLIEDDQEAENLASKVQNTGDVYFVPAFNGLFAPYWKKEARGVMCGLTAYSNKFHIIRASLEAICFQTRDIFEAMHKDCGIPLNKLMAYGEMSHNSLLMQLQADLSGVSVYTFENEDLAAFGAAIAAANADGIKVWNLEKESIKIVPRATFVPKNSDDERNRRYRKWKMAVDRSIGWVVGKPKKVSEDRYRLLASIPGGMFLITSFLMLLISQFKKI